MDPFSTQKYEYVTSVGEGTMVSLGTADNFHSVNAAAARDQLKSRAAGGGHVDLHYEKAPESCVTGK